ncbi:MAG: hypothetical protein ACRC8A_06365 [Microcoleaceae cyanobacterium]
MKLKIADFVKRSRSLIVGGFLIVSFIFLGTIGDVSAAAIAASINTPKLMATSASSLSQEVTGKVKEDIGTTQKKLGKVSAEVEGTVNQVKGRAKRDAGKTQAKLEDAQQSMKNRARKDLNTTQNTSDRASNRIAETADQVGDKVTETAEGTVDSIKNFFGQ